jgi:hypothetical protein
MATGMRIIWRRCKSITEGSISLRTWLWRQRHWRQLKLRPARSGVPFIEEQLTATRGGLTAEDYRL